MPTFLNIAFSYIFSYKDIFNQLYKQFSACGLMCPFPRHCSLRLRTELFQPHCDTTTN